MKIIDLSHIIESDMPVYPLSKRIEVVDIAKYSSDGFNEKSINCTTHTGTHIDCPSHVLQGKQTTDLMQPECFFGQGVVVDCTTIATEKGIDLKRLMCYEQAILKADFVLLHTAWCRYWHTDKYFSHYPVLNRDAVDFLAESSIKGVGMDTISVDSSGDVDLYRHKKLLNNNIIIIENLKNLHLLIDKNFIFSCFPLKIKKGDGSPTRAVAILDNEFD